MRRTLATIAIAIAGAIGLLAVQPSPAAAANGYDETATTVYRLDPAKGALRVTVTIKVTNRTPDSTQPYQCVKYTDGWLPIPYPSTCYQTTRYYLTTTSAVVENEAASIKATSGGKALAISVGSKGTYYRVVTITFPKLFYGKTRTVALTYSVKGGAPRSDSATRTMRAYASFCSIANGADSGSVTVRVPKGFDVTTTGEKLRAQVSGKERVFTSGRIADPSSWFACFTGTNKGGYRTEKLSAGSGHTIRLQSWPEDPAWAKGVRADVAAGLPALEQLVGSGIAASASLNVQESSTGNEYAGFYDPDTSTVTVDEDFRQPALVEHELAHVWFNGETLKDIWMSEGFAEWAGRTVSGDEGGCTRPDVAPSSVTLAEWRYLEPRSTEADRQAVTSQYDAACWVVTAVAKAAGEERMTAAVTALLGRRDPYSADPAAKRAAKVATWKDWLDAVDELALAPAGASETLASDLLLEYGAATDRDLLAQRTAARRAYHQLLATVDGWVAPAAVRRPLAGWSFGAAGTAIEVAGRTWELTGQTDQVLAGVDARHGPAADAWEAATTIEDLQAAADLAQRQLAAAQDVADARSLADRPLDVVQQVGMFGTLVPSLDVAVPAVRAGDGDTAASVTAAYRATLAGLRATGEQRIVVGGGMTLILLALLLGLAAWRLQVGSRRRAEARLASSTVATSGAHAWTAGPVPGLAPVPGSGRAPAPGPRAGPAPGAAPGAAPGTGPGAEPRATPRAAPSGGDLWATNPLDDSPTQVWDRPIVVSDPDAELAALVRPVVRPATVAPEAGTGAAPEAAGAAPEAAVEGSPEMRGNPSSGP